MKSNTKKVIIWVACVLLVAALAVTASVLITNYERKKPERLAGDFRNMERKLRYFIFDFQRK